jgi:hypothetical protein
MACKGLTRAVVTLVLAAGTIPVAQAWSRTGIALQPPMPETTAPGGSVVSPAFPSAPPGALPTPPGSLQPLTPDLPPGAPTTTFSAPQALPLIAPDAPLH